MGKQAIIDQKIEEIQNLKSELDFIDNLELRRLYKITEVYDRDFRTQKDMTRDLWGYIETFNKESFRFKVLAANANDGNVRNTLSNSDGGRRRRNITQFGYQHTCLTRGKKEEVPLLIGMPFCSQDIEKLLKSNKIAMD